MISFSLANIAACAIALASAANAAALPSTSNNDHVPFLIQACDRNAKGPGFSNQYVNLLHVGAGQNLLVMTSKHSEAAAFAFNGTRVYEPGTNYPFSLDRTRPQAARQHGNHSEVYTAPEGYRSTSLSASDTPTEGLYTGPHQKGVEPFFYKGELEVRSFVVCTVPLIAYFKGPENQFMWRTRQSKADPEHCSDVFLTALFYDEETKEFPKGGCKAVTS